MKTKYKYIHFIEYLPDMWRCYTNKDNYELGDIEFYKRWKQFIFNPTQSTASIFSSDCLRDIADFLEQLNKKDKDND